MVVGLQRRWADVLKHSEEPEVMGIPRSKVSGSPMVHVVLLCTNPMLDDRRLGSKCLEIVQNKAEPREATGELGIRHGHQQQEGGSVP